MLHCNDGITNFADPSLIVESLVGVMEKVTPDEGRRREMWKRVLEWESAMPSSYIGEVYTKCTTAKQKTHALVDIYVNIRPDSSWQHLVRILYDESEMQALKEVKLILQQNGGLL